MQGLELLSLWVPMRRAGRVTLATDRAQCGGSCLRTPLLHGPDVRMTLPVISALRIKHRQHCHDVLQSHFSFWRCEQARGGGCQEPDHVRWCASSLHLADTCAHIWRTCAHCLVRTLPGQCERKHRKRAQRKGLEFLLLMGLNLLILQASTLIPPLP